MPVPPVWSIHFFFMLITLGFSSEFSMMECYFSAIITELPNVLRRSKNINVAFRLISLIVAFLITLPMFTEGGFYLFNPIDVMVSGLPLLFVGLFEVIAISYNYGFNTYSEDIALMLCSRPGIYWKATWCVITPLFLVAVILYIAAQCPRYLRRTCTWSGPWL